MKRSSAFGPGHPVGGKAHRGFTILELITVVTLVGMSIATALPAAQALFDRMAVLGARESAVGVFHRARMEAVARGGARILLRSSPASIELWSGDFLLSVSALGETLGVEMTLSSGGDRAEIAFDPLGLGQIASQTLLFKRDAAEAGLVVSSLGRVTRR